MCRQHVEAALKNKPTKILLVVIAVIFIKVAILSLFFPNASVSSIHSKLFEISPLVIVGIGVVVVALHAKLVFGSIKKHFTDTKS